MWFFIINAIDSSSSQVQSCLAILYARFTMKHDKVFESGRIRTRKSVCPYCHSVTNIEESNRFIVIYRASCVRAWLIIKKRNTLLLYQSFIIAAPLIIQTHKTACSRSLDCSITHASEYVYLNYFDLRDYHTLPLLRFTESINVRSWSSLHNIML